MIPCDEHFFNMIGVKYKVMLFINTHLFKFFHLSWKGLLLSRSADILNFLMLLLSIPKGFHWLWLNFVFADAVVIDSVKNLLLTVTRVCYCLSLDVVIDSVKGLLLSIFNGCYSLS